MKKTMIFENEESYDKWFNTKNEKEGGFDFIDNRIVVINSYRIINNVKFNGFSADATIHCKKPVTAVKNFVKILKSYGYDINIEEFESVLNGDNYYGLAECGMVIEMEQIEEGVYYINYMCFQDEFSKSKTSDDYAKEKRGTMEIKENIVLENSTKMLKNSVYGRFEKPIALKQKNEIPFMNNEYSENEENVKIIKKLNFLEGVGLVVSIGFNLRAFNDCSIIYNDADNVFKCVGGDVGILVNIMNPVNMIFVGKDKFKMNIADEMYKLPYIILDWITLNTISAFNDDMIFINKCGVFNCANGRFNGDICKFEKILKAVGVKIMQKINVDENDYYLVYDKKTVEEAIKKMKKCERSEEKMITIVYNGKKYNAEIIGEYYDRDFAEIIHTHTNTPQEFFDEYIKLDPDFIKLFEYDFYPVEE